MFLHDFAAPGCSTSKTLLDIARPMAVLRSKQTPQRSCSSTASRPEHMPFRGKLCVYLGKQLLYIVQAYREDDSPPSLQRKSVYFADRSLERPAGDEGL